MHGHTCELFDNTINNVQNKVNGEINTAYYNNSKNRDLIVYKVKGKKISFL